MQDIECPYMEKCPIRGSSEKIKLLWIVAYCGTVRFAECARFKIRQKGEQPEFTLLPDGTFMTPAVEAQVRAHVEECDLAGGSAS